MRSSYDACAARLYALAAAARHQPAWFGAALALAVVYVAFLLGMKGHSQNVADSFFEELPARAAANPVLVDLPLCMVFTPASPSEDARLFGFGGYESWSFPRPLDGRRGGGPRRRGDRRSERSGAPHHTGTALTGPGRPQVAYRLSVNGEVLAHGALTQDHPKLDLSVVVPAALQAGRGAIVAELRTPGIVSARAAGISQDWRKLGISINAISLFRLSNPACP